MPRPAIRALAGTALLLLGGCGATVAGVPALGALAVAEAGAIVLLDRGLADTVVSLATGRDCSVVRTARDEGYCAPPEAPPAPPRFCTRSLGAVDCWTLPPAAHPPQRGVADGPRALNAEQEAHRTRRWPGL